MNRALPVFALPFLLCSALWAQPAEKPVDPQAPPPTPYSTPEGTVRELIRALQQNTTARISKGAGAASAELNISAATSGAKIGFFDSNRWPYDCDLLIYWPQTVAVDNVRLDAHKGDEATVTVTTSFPEQVGNRVENRTSSETVQLRREAGFLPIVGPGAWRIVPPPIGEVLTKSPWQLPKLRLATVLGTHDPRLEAWIERNVRMSQLKQLGLGALQFTQDYDEFFAFDDAGHERALRPYLKDDSLYTIAGTTGDKWRFNDNLSTLALAKLNAPAQTVLFYDGSAPSTDALRFRFDGKTLICFADGHVEALSKDEVGKLIWKP